MMKLSLLLIMLVAAANVHAKSPEEYQAEWAAQRAASKVEREYKEQQYLQSLQTKSPYDFPVYSPQTESAADRAHRATEIELYKLDTLLQSK